MFTVRTAAFAVLLCACGNAPESSKPGSITSASVEDQAPVTTDGVLAADDEVELLGGQAPDPSLLFDMSRVMEIQLELAPDDWETLRNQIRSVFDVLGGDCMAAPANSPYTWFDADLWLDGERMEPLSVRKKGFIGSQSITLSLIHI